MFKMVSSPHTHSSSLTAKIMLWVMGAMLPAIALQVVYFGVGVLIQLGIALGVAALIELAVARLRGKALTFYLADLSGLLTAMILAVSIPPYAPWWISVIGMLTALGLAKHCYGGLGQNPFNPAMVAYALLLVSFPVYMTGWMPALSLFPHAPSISDGIALIFTEKTLDGSTLAALSAQIDGLTQATPLDSLKTNGAKLGLEGVLHSPIFNGQFATGWWQINLTFLAGGLVLWWKKVIHWQMPVAMLASFSLLACITDLTASQPHLPLLTQLFSGAMMFGAFFIATDPVSAPVTPRGKLIFGALVGILLYFIRYQGNYPDGVAFSILLANICVPLIDYYTQPRVYGHQKRRK